MKGKTANAITWLLAILLTAAMTWSAHQHHLPLLQIMTITASVLYATKNGGDTLVRGFRATRNGAAR